VAAGDIVTHDGTAEDFPLWGPQEIHDLREHLKNDVPLWDVVVVGAGITGAGIAREAAQRGMHVLVVEARDVAYGTSSRSTRLVHGGVRYLEHGELGLVFEALRERSWLMQAAPHLVRPERFLFPAYRGDRLAPWKLRVGLTLYDMLNVFRGRTHALLDRDRCLQEEPLLAADGLRGAVLYDDAVTDDARLTLTTLQDARRHGAAVLTYARVERIESHDTEHRLRLDSGLEVRARQAVVAAGPWSGPALLGDAGRTLLTHSKGVHIVLRASDVPLRRPLVIQVPGQQRILFGVPWGARTYLGTTDDPFAGDLHDVGVTEAEEHELLQLVARVLPSTPRDPSRIISAWAGIRPLVRPALRNPNAHTEKISRKHRIIARPDGVLGIVGGKLTTFRAMARDLVDRVHDRLERVWPDGARRWTRETGEAPLVPGEPLQPDELADPVLAELARRHGPVARHIACADHDRTPLVDGLPYLWCEIDRALSHEGAIHVGDVLRRRIPLALTDEARGGRVARHIAERLVDARGGNAADVREELERYREETWKETRRAPVYDDG